MTEYSDGFHDWMVDHMAGCETMSERAYRFAAIDAIDAWNEAHDDTEEITDLNDAVQWWMEQREEQG